MSRTPSSSPFVALASLLLLAACSGDAVAPAGGEATLLIRADVSGTSVATVVVDISAPDLPTTVVFNVPVAAGVASGTLTIPAGSDRTIVMRAFDAGGVQTHTGSVTLNVQPGTNPTIVLVLTPLTGNVPIHVTLGSFAVTLSPPPPPLVVGQTVPLNVSITDWNGNPVTVWNGNPVTNATVSWATDHPGIASVNGSGLVTAQGAGSTKIAATFQGAVGTAAVTVTP